MYCIERSVSMIWLEKPPTNSVREIDKLFEKLADRGGLCKVLVNYQRRYMESYRKLRTMYLEKKLGDCRLIQLNYSRGLQLNGSHILDTLFFIVGDSIGYELEWVSPFGGPENPCFALTLENGLGVMISGIALAYHCIDISLVCENGRASIMHGGMKPVVEEKVEHEWFPGFYRLKESENDYLGDEKGLVSYMKLALEDLINSYERSEEPQSNLQSARNAQELIEQVRHRQVN
jgi:predicted dehydrogenase